MFFQTWKILNPHLICATARESVLKEEEKENSGPRQDDFE
jgi:hypothetical protein